MALNLDDIRYFVKAAETLNITRASEQLGITQPTLSYSIKRLELELGAEVIIRLKNGIQLTKLGEEFLKRARKLMLDWEGIENLVDPEDQEVRGEYKIAIHPSVALFTLDKFLPEIIKNYPHLNFKFIHGLSREMTEKVISWDADFGIVVNPIPHPDLVIKELYRDTVTLFSIKGAAKKVIMDPDLTQTQHILRQIKEKEIFNDKISTGSLEIVLKLASLGLGYGLLPKTIASVNSSLVALKGAPCFEDRVCLIYRRDKHKNNVSKYIFDTIYKKLS